jgi:hypothetical protein
MKRIVFSLSLLLMTLLVSPLLASTNVGATISGDTQWDASGSPYIIQARVLVPPGVTLKVGPGVQIVFQGPATLQIGGDLRIEGSAAAPAVINMTDGGLQSALFIDGGEAHLTNMKVIGGVFLAQDATIRMDASEVTKGSGLYLKGSTVAHLKNNKFYGNATGVVLDGPIEADMQFNTLVQNTYGLYLKDYVKLVFVNNSVHDNESEVVNNAAKAKLGGNYWGSMSPKTVKDKIKGEASISPMKDLKDVLRAYLRSELPIITQGMSDQAEAEDLRADKAAREALKAFRYKQSQADVLAMEAKMKTQTPNATPTSTAPPTPVDTATPIPSPTMAPMMDINLPTAVPTSVPAVVPIVAPVMSAPVPAAPAAPEASTAPAASSVPAAPAAPAAPAIPEPPPITDGLPAPPMVSPNAPAPPALGDLAGSVPPPTNINSVPTSGSPIPSLPTSVPPSMSSTAPATPTPGLGGGSVSSDDLASIVATAQAASTSTNSTVAPPMPPDMTTLGSADASAQSAVNTSTPTVMATSTYTSVPNVDTSNFTATPTMTFTMVITDTPTYTSTPIALIATPTPTAPNVSFVPTVAAPASAAPASAAPAVPAGNLVPPPPDFGDSPMQGVQPPMVNTSDASMVPASAAPSAPVAPSAAPAVSAPAVSAPVPAIPSASASSAPAAAAPSVPKPPSDLDVDGMQAPPMDSGLDYANPKK